MRFQSKKGIDFKMYLIVGLGNPEPEYSYTRHNVGFDVVNKLSNMYNIQMNKSGFKAIYGIGKIENENVILCKPQTYMNLSGDSLIEIANFYKITSEKIIIIYDDIDIETGTIKLRKKGGPGGHNGMKSIIFRLQTQEFPRIRVGTGFCKDKEHLINYVISKVSNEEYMNILLGINAAKDAVVEIIKNGIDKAMNKFN